jgi:hypothetical protein
MKHASILVAAIAFGTASFAMTREAHALGPIDLEIGARAGIGTDPVSNNDGPNPLGFGLGGRAGIDFMGFYGGVSLLYYFGGSEDVGVPGETAHVSAHTFMYGLDLGYGISLSILTIRPQLGIGNATFSGGSGVSGLVNGEASSGSKSNLYLEPGVTGLVSLGLWFVGADANILFFPGLDNSKASFTLHGQVGIKL